ncbi:hypothetical protein AB0J38_40970 [Streptomyces sp. NPDC050095]|uniref:hypothetical protein n=1 Tax=unclassified Streptomyces TaxID=2593676 RepID=UPI00341C2DEC
MGRPPQPRHIMLGGHEAVALTIDEYAQLIASRRQIGGQSARVRVLAHQAKRTERLVRGLEELVEECAAEACRAAGTPQPGQPRSDDRRDDDCPRCAVAELLRGYKDMTSG